VPVLDIKTMVDRFLGWRLPDDFGPDCGISFKPLGHPNGWPVGTNLFTAAQAETMFRHALGIVGEPAHAECQPPLDATEAAERQHMGCAHCGTGIYAQKSPEPVYQVLIEDPHIWRDVTEEEYAERQPSSRRKVHFAPRIDSRSQSAVRTLERLRYTYEGGQQWRPPLGKPPVWVDVKMTLPDNWPSDKMIEAGRRAAESHGPLMGNGQSLWHVFRDMLEAGGQP
jgi:hypothetical protein